VWGGGASDALEARGELGQRAKQAVEAGRIQVITPFRIRAIAGAAGALRVTGTVRDQETAVEVDQVIVCTGFRPNLEMLSEIRLGMDPWLECAAALGPLIDPNEHSCGTVRPHGARELAHPEKDFYVIGMKSYGRAPTFLLATGYEQTRSVVAAIAGDLVAADDVQLVLPETGVCSSDLGGGAKAESTACCTTSEPVAAPAPAAAACCGPKPAEATAPKASGCCG
jgi:hypothetical protein